MRRRRPSRFGSRRPRNLPERRQGAMEARSWWRSSSRKGSLTRSRSVFIGVREVRTEQLGAHASLWAVFATSTMGIGSAPSTTRDHDFYLARHKENDAR